MVIAEAMKVLDGGGKAGRIPALWDGHTAERIAEVFRQFGVDRGMVRA